MTPQEPALTVVKLAGSAENQCRGHQLLRPLPQGSRHSYLQIDSCDCHSGVEGVKPGASVPGLWVTSGEPHLSQTLVSLSAKEWSWT